jgi:hypothetical protein
LIQLHTTKPLNNNKKNLNNRNHHIPINTNIELIDITPPSKDTIWQAGLKRKIQQSEETHLIDRNKHWLRVKGWKKIYQANSPQKQPGVAILVLNKVDFKLTLIKQGKEGHSILKGEIHQKEIAIINLYAYNVSAPNFIKHTMKDLKAHIDSNTMVAGDVNNHYH